MKKITPSLFAILFTATCGLAFCDSAKLNKEAEQTASVFYSDLQKNDYKAAIALCSDQAFTKDDKEKWTKAMERNAGLLGKMVSFTKSNGENISVSTNSGPTVAITYDVQWQYGLSKDSVLLVKDKDGKMKVYRYSWQHSQTKYYANMDESERLAKQYMSAIQEHQYEAAIDFCAKEALDITPKSQWMIFFENADQKMGTLESFTIDSMKTTYAIDAEGQAGKGNYYDVFVKANRNGKEEQEKIVFFQKDYDEPLKLAGHNFL